MEVEEALLEIYLIQMVKQEALLAEQTLMVVVELLRRLLNLGIRAPTVMVTQAV